MKIQQTDTYPCGETKTYPRYEIWGLSYAPNSGKPGCPKHGHRCKTKDSSCTEASHFFSWRGGNSCQTCGKKAPEQAGEKVS